MKHDGRKAKTHSKRRDRRKRRKIPVLAQRVKQLEKKKYQNNLHSEILYLFFPTSQEESGWRHSTEIGCPRSPNLSQFISGVSRNVHVQAFLMTNLFLTHRRVPLFLEGSTSLTIVWQWGCLWDRNENKALTLFFILFCLTLVPCFRAIK